LDEDREKARARIGQVLASKWTLDELLGVGGMAAVYAATHRNGARAAVKILHDVAARDQEARDRFLREGYLANQVGHEGVVAVLDDDVTADGTPFVVMELLDGATLDAVCEQRGGVISTGEALWIADQVLDALGAAHQKGVVHRDLKPQNLFLNRSGKVKILDFGIARAAQKQNGRATQMGNTMGTPGFMAPEQARGTWDAVDGRTDLWALGATLYTALTAQYLHEAATPNLSLLEAMTRPAPPIQTMRADLPDAVAAIVDRALAFAPEDRFPDAAAMREAVRAASDTVEEQPVVPAAIPAPVVAEGSHDSTRESGIRGESIRRRAPTKFPTKIAVGVAAPIILCGLVVAGLIAAHRRGNENDNPTPAAVVAPVAPGSAGANPVVRVSPSAPAPVAPKPAPKIVKHPRPAPVSAPIAAPIPAPRVAPAKKTNPSHSPSLSDDPLDHRVDPRDVADPMERRE
jgi:serine/threonine-protein kinase